MNRARLAGLDVGDKRIGVAVSDALGMTAQGLGVVQRQGKKADAAAIMALLADYEVSTFVAGLPLEMSGAVGDQADRVQHFCRGLEEITGIAVVYQDERLTTRQSERMLVEAGVRRGRRKKVIDQVAAVLILQAYLDTGGGGPS